MNIIIPPDKITQELLLHYNSEETYMEHYLGIPVKKGLFKSPLRKDNKPTCAFYRDKAGRLIFKDFRGDFYGNFVEVVKKKYNVSYRDALRIIANDFKIVETLDFPKHKSEIKQYTKTEFKQTESSVIRVQIKDFSQEELDYWKSYGISLNTLNKYLVFSCHLVLLNDDIYAYSSSNEFVFGYFYPSKDEDKQYWRIYFPKRRGTNRFISNWNKTMIQGIHMLPKSGEFLVITKSMKDVMLCYELGIPAIAPNSENLFITEAQWDKLIIRFKHIFLLYDTDLAGVENSIKIKKQYPNIKVLLIPRKYKAKDLTDLYKKLGTDKILSLINNAKNYYLNKS